MMAIAPPVPTSPEDATRWRRVSQIRRILGGAWERDATARLRQMISQVRREVWGPPDLTANPLKVFATELARSYDAVPAISPAGGPLGQAVVDHVIQSGHFARMTIGQRDAWACGDVYVHLDLDRWGRVTTQLVHGDRLTAEPDPEHPDQPIILRHARLRRLADSTDVTWTWDEWDLSDPKYPRYRVLRDNGGKPGVDVTALAYPGKPSWEGEAYPWRYADGEPHIPYVAYRGTEDGGLWHDATRLELVEGTLILSVYYTFFGHILRSASWPQRYMAGVEPMGGSEMVDTGLVDKNGDPILRKRGTVAADPASVIVLEHMQQSTGQPIIGQWEPGGDPAVIIEAIMQYERRLASFAGIAGSDLIRSSGDPRSGFAVHVSRSAVREQMRRIEPLLRRADQELLRKTAALLSRATGRAYPESGYEIVYQGVPESPEEREARERSVSMRLREGLTDRIEALIDLNPGLTREAAAARVAEIDKAKSDGAPTPLNGAQLQQAITIVERLTYGELDDGPAMVLLMASGMDEGRAEELIGSVTKRERPVDP